MKQAPEPQSAKTSLSQQRSKIPAAKIHRDGSSPVAEPTSSSYKDTGSLPASSITKVFLSSVSAVNCTSAVSVTGTDTLSSVGAFAGCQGLLTTDTGTTKNNDTGRYSSSN